VSTGKTKAGLKTGTFYTTVKNKRNGAVKGTGKLELKKFDSRAYNEEKDKCGMHVIFKEDKIK
jgi:ribosomal protein L33